MSSSFNAIQFEAIHPFYDGNGRTGRILNVLYLVLKEMLDSPITYLSRYILDNKTSYYKLLKQLQDNLEDYEEWILFILAGIEETSIDTLRLVKESNGDRGKKNGLLSFFVKIADRLKDSTQRVL